MVLKPHGIEQTFLKSNMWSTGAGFIPIKPPMNKMERRKKECKKKKVLCIHETFDTFLKKMGSIPCWVNSTPTLGYQDSIVTI